MVGSSRKWPKLGFTGHTNSFDLIFSSEHCRLTLKLGLEKWNLANEMEITIKNNFDLLSITRQLVYFNIIQLIISGEFSRNWWQLECWQSQNVDSQKDVILSISHLSVDKICTFVYIFEHCTFKCTLFVMWTCNIFMKYLPN